MNADDLLSFKEYSPVHESHAQGGSAQINVNSPSKQQSPYANTTTTANDPLQDLINSMSASVNVLHNEDRQRSPNGGNNDVDGGPPPNNLHSIFSIEFYQKYFNVDTAMVVDRIASAIIPHRAPVTYLKQNIGSNPDLYGPFWIVVTLVFSIAISGNIASYLQEASTNYHWRYNFHLVSIAATTIVVYVCLVPFGLWAAFKWSKRPTEADLITEGAMYTPSLLSLICVYGYSLSIYIPISVLWLIQVSFLQWLLVFGAALSTGTVLIIVLSPALQNSTKSVLLIGGILAAHFLLAAGFMLHFFHVPSHTTDQPISVATVNRTS